MQQNPALDPSPRAISFFVFTFSLAVSMVFVLMNFIDLHNALTYITAAICLFVPSLRTFFIMSLRQCLKTIEGRAGLITMLAFLPSIFLSIQPKATGREWVELMISLTVWIGMYGMAMVLKPQHVFIIRRNILYIALGFLLFVIGVFSFSLTIPDDFVHFWINMIAFKESAALVRAKAFVQFSTLLAPILIWSAFRYGSSLIKILSISYGVLVVIAVVLFETRNAVVGLLAMGSVIIMGIFFLKHLPIRKKLMIVFCAMLIFMSSFAFILKEGAERNPPFERQYPDIEKNLPRWFPPTFLVDNFRQVLWLSFLTEWKENPFFGVGFVNKRSDQATKAFIKLTNIPRSSLPYDILGMRDNFYLQILCETGLVGFIPFIIFLVILFLRSMRMFFHERSTANLLILGLHAGFWSEVLFFFNVGHKYVWFFYISAWVLIRLFDQSFKEVEAA